MQIDFDISRFKAPDKKKILSARAEIIGNIVEEINKCRAGTEWPPITARGVAMKVSHIKDLFTLGWLLKEGQKQESFSRYFFGVLKTNKK